MEQNKKKSSARLIAILIAAAVLAAAAFSAFVIALGVNKNVSRKDEPSAQIMIPEAAELVGTDTEKNGGLTLTLNVYYDRQTNRYIAEVNAAWQQRLTPAWKGEESAEESYPDYVRIFWDEAVMVETSSFGQFYNDRYAEISRPSTASYAGIVCSFFEKSGTFGKELRQLTIRVLLEDVEGEPQHTPYVGAEYVHTYPGVSSTSISISPGGSLQRWELGEACVQTATGTIDLTEWRR